MAVTTDKTVAEFFAGIGLMRAGLESAGWTILFANDIDPRKQRLYHYHFQDNNNHFVLKDIHQLSIADVPTTTLAVASFPCTDLSLAGKREGLHGRHSSAFWGFVRILEGMREKKPPLILLENVVGFLHSRQGEDFKVALSALNKLGYAIDAFMIDAAHFVPQSRVRLFVIGKQKQPLTSSKIEIVENKNLRPAKLAAFIRAHPEIAWDIRNDLPDLPIRSQRLADIVEDVPKDSSLWHSTDRVEYLLSQTSERHRAQIKAQMNRKDFAYFTAFRRVRQGKSMAEIRFDGIAGCLRTPKGGSAKQLLLRVGRGAVQVRLLTPKECARLMGADDFRLSGTLTDALFGFGDAVCVPVVAWIAEHYLNPTWLALSALGGVPSPSLGVSG